MRIEEIIDQITYIIIVYYKTYRNIHSPHDDHVFMDIRNIILEIYHQRFDVIENIESVDILPWPWGKRYMLQDDISKELKVIDSSTDIESIRSIDNIMNEIIDDIISYINQHTIIYNASGILSINVCPFDGLMITHEFIIRILDLYFYWTMYVIWYHCVNYTIHSDTAVYAFKTY